MRYRITPHAARRLAQRRVTSAELQAVLYEPELVFHCKGRTRHKVGDLSAILDGRYVITVMRGTAAA